MAREESKVLVAMSGGVDSSVAAWLLREQGYDVTGVFLCMGRSVEADHETSGCCSAADAADARQVADLLGIPLFVLDCGQDFARIIDYFIDEYLAGRTPNPCVHCNALIKFDRLMRHADELGVRYVATGHYARIRKTEPGGVGATVPTYVGISRRADVPLPSSGLPAFIHRAAAKDQSYALFALDRRHLGRMLLPIGELADKSQTRLLAAKLGLPVADKPDSQEICFVSGEYVELLRRRRPEALREGNIVDAAGNVLGRHRGVAGFTIGQRRGLGVARGQPMYVTRIDPATATVVIGPKEEVMSRRLVAREANWHIDPPAVGSEFEAIVQIRYNHEGAPARVRITGPREFEAEFAQPVAAITPGQAAVIYDGDRLLGGGWIFGSADCADSADKKI